MFRWTRFRSRRTKLVEGGKNTPEQRREVNPSPKDSENVMLILSNFRSLTHRYDVIRKLWTECSPMTEKRSFCALVNDNNNVYAIGGMNETILATVEMYDTEEDEWTQISSMIKPRAASAAAVLNGFIYVMGGGTEINTCETDTVERYDIENDTWSMVATLSMARDYLAATIFDNKLVVVGGYDSNTQLTAIFEVFEEEKNKWCVGVLCERSAGGTLFSL